MSGKSIYWKYFQKKVVPETQNAAASCNICAKTISLGGSGKTANTSNMRYHLMKFHADEYKEICNEQGKAKTV